MPHSPPQEIDSLSAPRSDHTVLVWPEGGSLVDLARANRTLRNNYKFELLGSHSRQWFSNVGDAPLTFLTGHQPEFFHPGVWAKNVGVSRLAEESGGTGVFLVVDSDTPHRMTLEWPDDSEQSCRIGSAGLRSFKAGPSYEHLTERIAGEMGLVMGGAPTEFNTGGENLMGVVRAAFIDPIDPSAGESPVGRNRSDYVSRWIRAMRAMEAALGCQSPEYQRVSDWFDWHSEKPDAVPLREASAAFVAHLITHARAFATCYNDALDAYRRRRGMSGRQHPIPDLTITENRIELPFWHVGSTAPRHRLWVSFPHAGAIELHAEAERLGAVNVDDLAQKPLETLSRVVPPLGLRPRALAQTLFARLFQCDLFVHGIGGAKYDTITDDIIQVFFGVEPPAYACITATVRLPVPRFGVSEGQLDSIHHAARDVRFNPMRYVDGGNIPDDAREWIELREQSIAESTRLHAARSRERDRRRAAFHDIRRANDALLKLLPGLKDDILSKVDELERQAASDQIAASREWFTALHSKSSLLKLMAEVRDALAV